MFFNKNIIYQILEDHCELKFENRITQMDVSLSIPNYKPKIILIKLGRYLLKKKYFVHYHLNYKVLQS